MNLVKYRKTVNGEVRVKLVRIVKRHRDINRQVRCKRTHMNKSGLRDIPPRHPTRHMADLLMLKDGWTR